MARQRGLQVQEGSADDLPFDDGTFDLVTLLYVVHVPNEHGVFSECYRVLRRPDPLAGKPAAS